MATEQKQDGVTFVNVQKSYPPGELLNIGYTLAAELKRSTRDWVGLFRVGWSSSRDYYTFEWAPLSRPDDNVKGEVTFAGRRLPPEDNHFYQFCYVTSDGRVRGASAPFQFLAVSLARVDDLELVEVGEESLMILQPKQKEKLEVIRRNESLKYEKEQLVKQLEVVERNNEAKLNERDAQLIEKEAQLLEKDEHNTELKRQLVTKQEAETRLMERLEQERALNHDLKAAKQESEQRLSEKLERERALNHGLNAAKQESEQRLSEKLEREHALNEELTATKSEIESQLTAVKQQLAERDNEHKSVKDENAALLVEMGDLRAQLQINNARVEDLSQLASTRGEEKEQLTMEAEQLQGRLLEVQQIRADLIEDNEAKQFEIERLSRELAMQKEDNEQLKNVIEDLKQDVACAQENVIELVGAGKNTVVMNQPTNAPADRDEPPTQPPTQAAIVDKAAYDALLQAYDSLETSYAESKQAHKELAKRLQETEVRSDEMVARLEQAREKYEALAKENHELQKRGGRSPQLPSDKPLDRQMKEMESINKELVASCEVASQQLSARKEEMKQQQARVDELERDLAQVKQEMADFKQLHEDVLLTKSEALDKQQAVLDEKLAKIVELHGAVQALEKDKSKSDVIVHQLRSQLALLKAAAQTADRTCPVCQTKFPGRISQGDFERHVQGHFDNQV